LISKIKTYKFSSLPALKVPFALEELVAYFLQLVTLLVELVSSRCFGSLAFVTADSRAEWWQIVNADSRAEWWQFVTADSRAEWWQYEAEHGVEMEFLFSVFRNHKNSDMKINQFVLYSQPEKADVSESSSQPWSFLRLDQELDSELSELLSEGLWNDLHDGPGYYDCPN
jgi:hypothetical protein